MEKVYDSSMKLLIFSDSHGCLSAMEQAVNHEQPDHILHLGDHLRDAAALRDRFSVPVTAVPGNCDGLTKEPAALTLELLNKRIYMTHGHLHGVKLHYQRVIYAALEAEAGILLFGHTHRPECFSERGLWVMNPGACGPHGTYGVIELQSDHITCQLKGV